MEVRKYLVPIVKSYSAIVFSHNFFVGAVLLLLTFVNPNLGLGGLVAVVSAYLFARITGFKEEFLRLEFYIYNPLLVGLSLGYLFRPDVVSLVIFVIAGIFTFLITYFLSTTCWNYLGIPVLSVPFVISSSLFYLASLRFSNLFVTSLYPHEHFTIQWLYNNLPFILQGYLKALATIFFFSGCTVGLIIFILLFLASRILVFLSFIGYLTGVLVKWLLCGSYSQAVFDPASFNYILTAMAVGGFFLIPSPSSYRLACISAAIAVPVVEGARVFWENFGIPVFALPFNLVSLLLLYVLISLKYKHICKLYKGSPERTLDTFLTYTKRFPHEGRYIGLPFSGMWTVWQSFDGEWTHKGIWRYAVDFVITDEQGRTYKNDGYYLTDYYAFDKPVLSPVDGKVVAVVNSLPDNAPGEVDRKNNWGNHVMIYDNRGFYVLVCHFKQKSIKVKVGDYVRKGELLGLCGNSGYSPQPHIHIHVQYVPTLGAPTVPFSFSSYLLENRFIDIGVPQKDQKVEPVYPDKTLLSKLNFIIDQEMEFEITESNKKKTFKVKVKMAPDGTFYFTDGLARLYFGIQNNTFYFYHLDGKADSPLRYLFFAIPKLPLIARKDLEWEDYLPLISLSSKVKREFYLFLSSFKPELFEVKCKLKFLNREEILGEAKIFGEKIECKVKLAKDFGFEKLQWKDKVITKIKKKEGV